MHDVIPVVVMAGGKGRRIGGNKPMQLLNQSTLLDHALRLAERYSTVRAVSAGEETLSVPAGLPVLQDAPAVKGPIAGLDAALRFATELGAEHVMIVPCDTPFLPFDLLSRLYVSIGTAFAALPNYMGQIHPACSLWRTDALSLLPDYLATGRRALIGFAEAIGHASVDFPTDMPNPFLNINTLESLDQARQLLAAKSANEENGRR